MKRIVTHLLVAAGLAAGACGVAQAHSNLSIGLSLGSPAPTYVAPAYAAPQPVYYGHRWDDHRYYGGYRHDERGWDHDRGGYRDNHWNDSRGGNSWNGGGRGWGSHRG